MHASLRRNAAEAVIVFLLMKMLLAIAAAGAIGTLARHGLNQLVPRWTGTAFPWATLAVNVLGCFLFGFICAVSEHRGWLSADARIVWLTGFMGAFTTYSTFAFDTTQFLQVGRLALAAANVVAQLVLGIAAVLVGLAIGR